MKRLLGLGLLLALAAVLLWPAVTGRLTPRTAGENRYKTLANADLGRVLLDPRRYRGRLVDFNGQVAADPEYDGQGTHLQVHMVFGSRNTYIIVDYPATLEVTQGDFINIHGRVGAPFTGVTERGARLATFRVNGGRITPAAPEKALAPANAVWRNRVSQTKKGVTVSVERVEFAAHETRLYVRIINGRSEAIVTHVFNSVAAQDGKSFGLQPNQLAGYKEISVDLPSGAQDKGILVFPAMSPDKPVEAVLHLSGANWESSADLRLKPPRSLSNYSRR